MRKIPLLVITLMLINFSKAQNIADSIKMFIPEIDSVCSNNFIYVPVKSINFRNIMDFQGTIKWDSTILKLDSIFINTSVPYFNNMNVDSNFNLTHSFLTFLWADGSHNLTLSDSTTLFRMRYKILKSSQVSSAIYFTNSPTDIQVDTAADLAGFSDLATLQGQVFINGKINFIDTPTIIQNGNTFICNASCTPQIYFWYIYDCNGNLINTDSSTTNTYTSTQPAGSCYSVQCTARYANGVSISSTHTPQILPLKLLSFNSKLLTSNSVALNWQTSNEINISHFNIQRSINGKDFENIGKIDAKCCEYNFIDPLAINHLPQTIYYRLEIVDKDGSKTFSEIKKTNIQHLVSSIVVYPNPAKDIATIECANAKQVFIIDYLGKIVQEFSNPMRPLIVNTKQLTKGFYIVKAIMNNGEVKTEKLIIN